MGTGDEGEVRAGFESVEVVRGGDLVPDFRELRAEGFDRVVLLAESLLVPAFNSSVVFKGREKEKDKPLVHRLEVRSDLVNLCEARNQLSSFAASRQLDAPPPLPRESPARKADTSSAPS